MWLLLGAFWLLFIEYLWYSEPSIRFASTVSFLYLCLCTFGLCSLSFLFIYYYFAIKKKENLHMGLCILPQHGN